MLRLYAKESLICSVHFFLNILQQNVFSWCLKVLIDDERLIWSVWIIIIRRWFAWWWLHRESTHHLSVESPTPDCYATPPPFNYTRFSATNHTRLVSVKSVRLLCIDVGVGSIKSTQVDLGLPSRVKSVCSSVTVEIFWRRRFHCKSFQVNLRSRLDQ